MLVFASYTLRMGHLLHVRYTKLGQKRLAKERLNESKVKEEESISTSVSRNTWRNLEYNIKLAHHVAHSRTVL